MLERLRDPSLDCIDRRRRRVAGIDAAEYEQAVAIRLEDRRIVAAARKLDGESRDARLHQPVEQLRIGVLVLKRGAARVAVAQVNDSGHGDTFQAAVESAR